MTVRREGVAELPGASLFWQETGDPDAPRVVALHGLCSGAATWDRLAASLAARGRGLLAVDLRGHGRSSRPGRYACTDLRDDVLGLLDERGIERADLVGHSLGGHIAVLVAQHRPERVRRLLVEDASPPPQSREDAAVSTWRQRASLAAQSLLLLTRARSYDVRMTRPVITEVLLTPDPAWWSALSQVTATTLLVAGGGATHVSRTRMRRMCDELPDATLVTVPGAGHRVHSRHPEQFASVALPFLTA